MTSVHEEMTGGRIGPPTPRDEATGLDVARFAHACAYAVTAHGTQARKGTSIPYASHVLAVGALVLEHGGTTEQAIAGVLHDVVEDQGGPARLKEVRATFGDEVARLVMALSDAAPETGEDKAPWPERKMRYQEHLQQLVDERDAAVLVSACDRLHNLTAIGLDLDDPDVGTSVFSRFNAPDVQWTMWNHRRNVKILDGAPDALVPPRLKRRLGRALARVTEGAELARDDRRSPSSLRSDLERGRDGGAR
jgi:hypothetical protein